MAETVTKSLVGAPEHMKLMASKELIEAFSMLPNTTATQKEQFQREIGRLLMCEEEHNVSVKQLKEALINDYIFEASAAIVGFKKERRINFPIRKTDEDLLEALKMNWEAKGFTFRRFTHEEESRMGRRECFHVCLSW